MNVTVVNALRWSCVFAAAAIFQWVVIYTYLAPWWRSRMGRSLVANAALAMVTPLVFILALWFDINRQTSEILAWVEVGVFILTTLLLSWRSVIWWRISKGPEGDDREVRRRL